MTTVDRLVNGERVIQFLYRQGMINQTELEVLYGKLYYAVEHNLPLLSWE